MWTHLQTFPVVRPARFQSGQQTPLNRCLSVCGNKALMGHMTASRALTQHILILSHLSSFKKRATSNIWELQCNIAELHLTPLKLWNVYGMKCVMEARLHTAFHMKIIQSWYTVNVFKNQPLPTILYVKTSILAWGGALWVEIHFCCEASKIDMWYSRLRWNIEL